MITPRLAAASACARVAADAGEAASENATAASVQRTHARRFHAIVKLSKLVPTGGEPDLKRRDATFPDFR